MNTLINTVCISLAAACMLAVLVAASRESDSQTRYFHEPSIQRGWWQETNRNNRGQGARDWLGGPGQFSQ